MIFISHHLVHNLCQSPIHCPGSLTGDIFTLMPGFVFTGKFYKWQYIQYFMRIIFVYGGKKKECQVTDNLTLFEKF